ncbi:MAG: GGDEF domain-containing protein [Myxococcales bacterium]|nr:GGDEF domain-containing protein [Myxococcales bacterium]
MPSSSPESPRTPKPLGAPSATSSSAFEALLARLGRHSAMKRVVALPVGTVVVALCVLLLATGKLSFAFGVLHAVLYVLIALACLIRLAAPEPGPGGRRSTPPRRVSWLITSELATLPLAGVWLASSAFGADALLVFPLGLLVVSAATARLSPQAAGVAVLAALALATAQWFGFGAWRGFFRDLVAEWVYIGGFGWVGWAVVRVGVASRAQSAGAKLGRYFAPSAAPTSAHGSGESLHRGVDDAFEARVEVAREACAAMLGLARKSLPAHSAVLLVRQQDDIFGVFAAASPDMDLLSDGAVPSDTGILAAALRTPDDGDSVKAIRLNDVGTAGLPYYTRTPARVRSAVAVPLRRTTGAVDAVLLVDRTAGAPFDEASTSLAMDFAEALSRSLERERDALNAALRLVSSEAVVSAVRELATVTELRPTHEAVLSAISKIHPIAASALVLVDDDGDGARVVATRGGDLIALSGARIVLNGSNAESAVALCIKNGTTIPAGRSWTPANGSLLGAHLGPRVPSGTPAFMMPLKVPTGTIGAVLVVAETEVDDEVASQLEAVLSQAAVAVRQVGAMVALEARATTDMLTGIDNRATLMTRLEQSMKRSQRTDTSLAVLALDVDHFKKVNDTWGHAVGDEVLRRVGATLLDCKRLTDSAGRVGGEEFVLVLEHTADQGALLVAERVRKAIASLAFQGRTGESFNVTCSIGVAIAPDHGKSREDVLRRADAALYLAKESGRNRVQLFGPRRTSSAPPAPPPDASPDASSYATLGATLDATAEPPSGRQPPDRAAPTTRGEELSSEPADALVRPTTEPWDEVLPEPDPHRRDTEAD